MTIDEFQKMALEIPTAVERSHMNHPDFRVAGKIFASLGVPDENCGMVKLTPEQQHTFIGMAADVFKPCSGAWGRAGYTNVYLAAAKAGIVRAALDVAAKNVAGHPKKKFAIARTRSLRAGLALAHEARALHKARRKKVSAR
jgi:hypothetical protein